jgi:hypothetical protein
VEWFEMAGLTFILIVFVVGMVVIVMRWLRHRERLAMIERGLIPPDMPDGKSVKRRGKGLLVGGLGLAVVGLLLLCAALFVALPVLTGLSSPVGMSSLGVAHLPGLLVLFMGVALLIVYLAAQPTRDAARTKAPLPVEEPPQETVPLQAPDKLLAGEPDEPILEPFADAPTDELEVKVASDE